VQATAKLRQHGGNYADNLPDLLAAIDTYLNQPTAQARTLNDALEMFDQPTSSRRHVKRYWAAHGRPPIRHFIPYSFFCMRVSMLFWHGVGLGLIGERPTNVVDLQYLFYLPFCMVFTSADKLHAQLAPLFLANYQRFAPGEDLHSALRELSAYYREHGEELRSQGMMGFASYPPLDRTTYIHILYDSLMPDWRALAAEPRRHITPEENARMMEKLRPMMEAIEAAQRAKDGKA
jgi:hypothetical protein